MLDNDIVGVIAPYTEANGALVLAKPTPDGYSETAKAPIVKGTCYTAPTLANGKLYIRSDKEMVCIEMKK